MAYAPPGGPRSGSPCPYERGMRLWAEARALHSRLRDQRRESGMYDVRVYVLIALAERRMQRREQYISFLLKGMMLANHIRYGKVAREGKR